VTSRGDTRNQATAHPPTHPPFGVVKSGTYAKRPLYNSMLSGRPRHLPFLCVYNT